MFYCGIANPERQKELTAFEIVFAIGIELMIKRRLKVSLTIDLSILKHLSNLVICAYNDKNPLLC